jgi:hypothetical protein
MALFAGKMVIVVKILVDEAVPEDKRREIERLVAGVIGERPDVGTLVVTVVKLQPGRGWSVFINDLQDSPVIEEIQAALKKAGF